MQGSHSKESDCFKNSDMFFGPPVIYVQVQD